MFYVFTDLLLPLIAGYILHREGLISERVVDFLVKINVMYVYSVLTLLSFWIIPLTTELFYMFPYGALYVLVPLVIGCFTFAKKHKRVLNRGAYYMSAMLSNLGTLGGVCAFILFSERGFAYSQIIATCQGILLVALCFPLAAYFRNEYEGAVAKHKVSFRKLFFSRNQISIFGIIIGLMLNYGGVERPEILSEVFPYLVHVAAWIAMLPIGYLIDFSKMRYYYKITWDISILRFLIMPLFVYITANLIFNDKILINTLLVCAAAPTAINAVVAAKLYKLNVNLAVTSFFTTTILFLTIVFPVLFFVMK